MSFYVVQSLLILIMAYILGAWTGCVIRSWTSYRRYERAYWANQEAFAAGISDTRSVDATEFRSIEETGILSEPEMVERNAVEPSSATSNRESDVQLSEFDLIRGISESDIKVLRDNGINSFSDIAAWSAKDVQNINSQLEGNNRIQQENWIEQAALLASGAMTVYADRFLNGSSETLLVDGEVQARSGEPADQVPEDLSRTEYDLPLDEISDESGSGNRFPVNEELPVEAEMPAAEDSMVTETGSGSDFSEQHKAPGEEHELSNVQNYLKPEHASPDIGEGEVDHVIEGSSELDQSDDYHYLAQNLKNTATEDGNIEEESELGETERSTNDDESPGLNAENGGVQIKSSDEQFSNQVNGETDVSANETRSIPSVGSVGIRRPADNLKRISGIGVIIERRLNSLGIYHYDQIAGWTSQEVDAFNEKLEFSGRIEREHWREQAEILSMGGETDFSLKFDRGEVGYNDEED